MFVKAQDFVTFPLTLTHALDSYDFAVFARIAQLVEQLIRNQ